MLKNIAIAVLAAMIVTAIAYADLPGISNTQTATRLDAATVWVGQSNGATSCNTVSETAAQDTLSFPASGGQYGYITELVIQNSFNATGILQTGTILVGGVTNLGLPANLSFASNVSTTAGFTPPVIIPFNPPLKSSGQGVAITFTPSATQSANNYLCMSAAGYYSNN